MKKFVRKNWVIMSGITVGAIAGYVYWAFVGCDSGSCVITSRPLNSVLYGAVMGGLLFSIFQKTGKKKYEG